MTRRTSSPITGITVRRFAPGEEVYTGDFAPGDFILTHGNAWTSRLIRVGQRLRFHGRDRKYTWWSHAAVIVSSDGALIEALGAGVHTSKLSKYKPTEYHLVQLDALADARDRQQVVDFAQRCLGEEYGYITVASIALSLLTGVKFSFGFDGQQICSGLVARALERTSAIFDRTPSHMMPADLAKCFGVEPPAPGTDKGQIPESQLDEGR